MTCPFYWELLYHQLNSLCGLCVLCGIFHSFFGIEDDLIEAKNQLNII